MKLSMMQMLLVLNLHERWPASDTMRMRLLVLMHACISHRSETSLSLSLCVCVEAFLKSIIASGIKIKFEPCGSAGLCC